MFNFRLKLDENRQPEGWVAILRNGRVTSYLREDPKSVRDLPADIATLIIKEAFCSLSITVPTNSSMQFLDTSIVRIQPTGSSSSLRVASKVTIKPPYPVVLYFPSCTPTEGVEIAHSHFSISLIKAPFANQPGWNEVVFSLSKEGVVLIDYPLTESLSISSPAEEALSSLYSPS